MNVLLIKMSSLGDIVHTLPAVADAARQGVRFDWVVEEDYRALAVRATGVERVVEVAFRRWRQAPITYLGELRAFRERLRQRHYDRVLDVQGLMKSAVVACWAHADERLGLDAASARERVASLAYHRRIAVSRDWHAIDRTRSLFAAALGYAPPDGEPMFGLGAAGQPTAVDSTGTVVLSHGTTWHTKHWPEAYWADLARRAIRRGLVPMLPWGRGERGRAERIARAAPGSRVCPPMNLDDVIGLLGAAHGVVGVDSGLTHLGVALGRPTVMLFGPTDTSLTGGRGPYVRNLTASLACSPCASKRCRLAGQERMRRHASQWAPPCLGALAPGVAWDALLGLMARQRAALGT